MTKSVWLKSMYSLCIDFINLFLRWIRQFCKVFVPKVQCHLCTS